MKYEGTRPAGKDKDINLYIFSVGKEELFALKNSVEYLKKHTVRIPETQILHSRLSTLSKQIGKISEGIK